jgi:hypothetical protein
VSFFGLFATWKTTYPPPTHPSIQSLCLQRRPQYFNAAIDPRFFPAKLLLMVKIRIGMIKRIGKVNFAQLGDQPRLKAWKVTPPIAVRHRNASPSIGVSNTAALVAPPRGFRQSSLLLIAPPSVFCALNTLAAMMQSLRYPRRNH